jgi:hypothetical protein
VLPFASARPGNREEASALLKRLDVVGQVMVQSTQGPLSKSKVRPSGRTRRRPVRVSTEMRPLVRWSTSFAPVFSAIRTMRAEIEFEERSGDRRRVRPSMRAVVARTI